MKNYRMKRLNSEVKKTISEIITYDVRDKRLANVGIVEVQVTPNLQQAKIFFTILEDKYKGQVIAGFKSANAYIRLKLAHQLDLRHTPQLKFIYDTTERDAAHLEELIESERERNEDDK